MVVEIDTVPTVLQLLGGSGEVTYTPREVKPGVSVMNIDGFSAVEDYLSGKFGGKRILKTILKNKMYRYFMAAAPGLKELMCVGKLWDLVDNKKDRSGRPLYDLVIADMPATGHGFSHLRMPQTAVDTLRIGFVKEEAAKILRLFQDAKRSALLIVTLAEEMPVNEAMEMRRLVAEDLKWAVGAIFVNGVYPSLLEVKEEEEEQLRQLTAAMEEMEGDPKWRPLLESALTMKRRRAMNRRYIEYMKSVFEDPLVVLPFLFTKYFGLKAIEELSQHIGESIGLSGKSGPEKPAQV